MRDLLHLRKAPSTWLLMNTFITAVRRAGEGKQSHLEQQVALPKSRKSFFAQSSHRDKHSVFEKGHRGTEVPVLPAGTEFNTRLHRPEL